MLRAERNAADNTVEAYERDLADVATFLARRGADLPTADAASIRAYLAKLHRAGMAPRTAARRLSAIRQFYRFLVGEGIRPDDPVALIDSPRQGRSLPKLVSEAEVGGLLEARNDAARLEYERALREAVRAPRVKILTQFTGLPDGVKFLVDLRADLLAAARDNPELEGLERELSGLLALWFDVGFLELQRITWDSPASLLERLIAYEAVHEIRSWDDLRNRLDSDRRCYAFFHPRMPREPLIFVEVALSRGLATSIQSLLDENQPAADLRKADTAIFYSISSTQPGLRGISFGNFLIKRVVDELERDFPSLRSYATLSPIPGFVRWLHSGAAAEVMLPASLQSKLKKSGLEAANARELSGTVSNRAWKQEPRLVLALEEPLLFACAHYLAESRNGLRPVDPVARFHLDNGARIERLNWLGDTSDKGMTQSAGIMVNYLYDLPKIEENHDAYFDKGKIACSKTVSKLLD